jgi:mono/diheme cytochrome c family protein
VGFSNRPIRLLFVTLRLHFSKLGKLQNAEKKSMSPQSRVKGALRFGAICVMLFSTPSSAKPNEAAGKAFAQANCSHCHSIDKFTPSTLAIAPPFRTLHQRYPVESLEEALGEGIVTGHPNMPEFRLDPGQVGDFISFLKSLEP